MLFAVELATSETAMVDDVDWDPTVSLAASDDGDSVCEEWGAALPSVVDALKFAELSETEAVAWFFRVASAEVTVRS